MENGDGGQRGGIPTCTYSISSEAYGPTARISIDYRISIDSADSLSLSLSLLAISGFFGRPCMLVVRTLALLPSKASFDAIITLLPYLTPLASSYTYPLSTASSLSLSLEVLKLFTLDCIVSRRGPLCLLLPPLLLFSVGLRSPRLEYTNPRRIFEIRRTVGIF